MESLPGLNLPTCYRRINGYIRVHSRACHVLYARVKDRWFFHDLPAQHSKLIAGADVKRKLFPKLEKAVGELQDEDVAENLQPIDQQQQERQEQQEEQQSPCSLTWRYNVRLVPVTKKGPGHRAYGMQGDRPMMAVVPTRNVAKGALIGFYLVRTSSLDWCHQ